MTGNEESASADTLAAPAPALPDRLRRRLRPSIRVRHLTKYLEVATASAAEHAAVATTKESRPNHRLPSDGPRQSEDGGQQEVAAFKSGRATRAIGEQLESCRGRLDAALWESDPSRQAYFEAGIALETALAKDFLQHARDPVPKRQRAHLNQFLGYFGPTGQHIAITDAATSAFLLAPAETWDEFDSARVRQLIEAGGPAAGIRERRTWAGAAAMSLIMRYPQRDARPGEDFLSGL